MCGVVAVVKRPDYNCPWETVLRMRDAVAHRGPDDRHAVFVGRDRRVTADAPSEEWVLGLGHRRLSILDPGPRGRQPLVYRDRLWITYNGEVFNYRELRADLERRGHCFDTSTDTEVVLAAYMEWGTECFRKFRGMWGMIVYDAFQRNVLISRDPLGIKPLYVWRTRDLVAVVSELKQLLSLSGFTPRIDRAMAGEYLRNGHEVQGRTFFQEVRPVPPGSWRRLELDSLRMEEPTSYWEPGRIQPVMDDVEEAARLFREKLDDSVRIHLRSDVPVGSALSGGLDSSALAVIASRHFDGSAPLHTFTATFPGERVDERPYVEAVTGTIDAVPHFVSPDPHRFLEDLDHFLWIHDEPVRSLSIYASYCVARLTREAGIPVILNGQGGDEVLAGYWQSYLLYLRTLARDGSFFRLAGHLGGALFPGGNRDLLRQATVLMRRHRRQMGPEVRVRWKRQNVLSPRSEVLDLRGHEQRVHQIRKLFLPRLLRWDDRNTMAFGVEGRYPFIDSELIELALSFQPELLYHRGWTKWPLRLALKGLVPPEVLGRRDKIGFEVPQDRWVQGPLRPVIQDWLGDERPLWDVVERTDVQSLADRAWRYGKGPQEGGESLLRLFMFDQWAERFGIL